ncbi:MAG: chromosome segregation protein SMC [Pseudomonadota bacterium]
MISRLIEAKPEEMRVYIEEAAGISKYKERRRETENRIRHTRENLERLTDLYEEVEKQIKHLDRQARAAERYKTYKIEERRTAAELLALRLRELEEKSNTQEHLLSTCETEFQAAVAGQRQIEAQIESTREAHTASTDTFNEVQGRFYKLGAEIARLEQAIEHGRELRERQQEDLRQATEGAAEILAHIQQDQSTLTELELALTELAPGLEQAKERAASSGASLQAAETAMADWRERWEAFSQEASQSEQTVQVEQARIEQLENSIERLGRQRLRINEDHDENSVGVLRTALANLTGEVGARSNQAEESAAALARVKTRIEHARSTEKQCVETLNSAQRDLQKSIGQHTAAKALQQAALGGAENSVTDWLSGSGLSERPRLAELLTVEKGWESAVETVLGTHLQAVSVENLDAAVNALDSLENGAVTLMQASQGLAAAQDSTLASKVSGAPSAIVAELQRVRVIPNLARALSVRSHLEADETLITQDGEWVGRDFLRVHRLSAESDSVLQREQQLRDLAAALKQRRALVEESEQALTNARSDLAALESEQDQAQEMAASAHRNHAEMVSQVDSATYRLQQAEEQLGIYQRELADIDAEQESALEHIAASQQNLDAANAIVESLDERRSDLNQQRASLSAELERVTVQAGEDREAAQQIALRYESRKSSKDSASQNLQRMQSQLAQFKTREEGLKQQLGAQEQPIEERKAGLAKELEARVIVEEQLSEARRALEAVDAQLRELEQGRVDAEAAVNAQREKSDQARMATQEARIRKEGLLEQFDSDQFDRAQLLQELAEDASIESWDEKLQKLVRRIDRLGPINLAAIDEFKEQSERKEYLDSQLADLNSALETLENAIRKIDRETRSRFKDTFDRVDSGFKRLFPQLFGGGHAYMELTGDDLLDAGITVMAQPPGKRNSTIHLLSGGEKALTAVALVFAIFELNPAPFCMLDEVDAPLDDANVNRFCEIVKQMSEHVQFVFITHNKVTMEMARQLSGVTMHEPGVSRLVTVDLDEAIKMTAS